MPGAANAKDGITARSKRPIAARAIERAARWRKRVAQSGAIVAGCDRVSGAASLPGGAGDEFEARFAGVSDDETFCFGSVYVRFKAGGF